MNSISSRSYASVAAVMPTQVMVHLTQERLRPIQQHQVQVLIAVLKLNRAQERYHHLTVMCRHQRRQ